MMDIFDPSAGFTAAAAAATAAAAAAGVAEMLPTSGSFPTVPTAEIVAAFTPPEMLPTSGSVPTMPTSEIVAAFTPPEMLPTSGSVPTTEIVAAAAAAAGFTSPEMLPTSGSVPNMPTSEIVAAAAAAAAADVAEMLPTSGSFSTTKIMAEGEVACMLCHSTFPSQDILNSHEIEVHGDDEMDENDTQNQSEMFLNNSIDEFMDPMGEVNLDKMMPNATKCVSGSVHQKNIKMSHSEDGEIEEEAMCEDIRVPKTVQEKLDTISTLSKHLTMLAANNDKKRLYEKMNPENRKLDKAERLRRKICRNEERKLLDPIVLEKRKKKAIQQKGCYIKTKKANIHYLNLIRSYEKDLASQGISLAPYQSKLSLKFYKPRPSQSQSSQSKLEPKIVQNVPLAPSMQAHIEQARVTYFDKKQVPATYYDEVSD